MTTWKNFAGNTGAAVTTWNYDPYQGLLASKTDADGQSVQYTYTDDGRLETRTWSRGALTTYSYDPATAEMLTVDYADTTPDVVYTYDRRGRIDTTTDAAGTLEYSYLEGRLEAETYTSGTFAGYNLDRAYDGLDRSAGWTLRQDVTDLHATAYGYADANGLEAGRLQTVSSGLTTARYTYEANSNLLLGTEFTHNSSTSLGYARQWDKLNRLQQIDTLNVASTALHRSAYTYNNVNQRTSRTLANGEYWDFEYDDLGQVTRAAKYGSNDNEIPGYRYGFDFDDIGNRTETDVNGRIADYSSNALNQYDNREVPRFLDILGEANASATVTVNGDPALRTILPGGSDYFYQPLAYGIDGLAEYERFRISAEDSDGSGGLLAYDQDSADYLPPAQEDFNYDLDGNLLSDGHWSYTWDSENRLIEMETLAVAYNTGAPRQKLEFAYDSQGRRFSKKVYDWDTNSNSYLLTYSFLYLYDGWNLITEYKLDSQFLISNSKLYAWGLDLSGTMQGAGGVGGLLMITDSEDLTYYPAFDGNGNVMGYYAADTGASVAAFEYGPFGELIRATGEKKDYFNFRFSTKYEDTETGLLYYGYRYYNAETGRWLNRDPIAEQGGLNLYGFVSNNAVNEWDLLGKVTVTQIAQIGHELGIEHPIVSSARNSNFNNLDEIPLIRGDFTGLIKLIQKKLGVSEDGDFGSGTSLAYDRWASANNGKVVLRKPANSKEVLDWITGYWPPGDCTESCPIGYGEFLVLIHYESQDISTKRNGRPTYFNMVGGPAGTMNLRTTAVGLGQITIDTAPDANLSYQQRYSGEESIRGALHLLFSDAERYDCNFLRNNRGLNRWEAWSRWSSSIESKGKKINELIKEKGLDSVSSADLNRILGI